MIAASGLAGMLSLAVSTYNVYLQRAQVRAQVWPHVEFLYSDVDGFEWKASNAGVGPAKIAGARLSIDGQVLRNWSELQTLVEKKVPGAFDHAEVQHSLIAGRVLPAGAEIHAFAVKAEDQPHEAERMRAVAQVLAGLQAEICYCSTLDECWLRAHGSTTQVGACPVDRLTFED